MKTPANRNRKRGRPATRKDKNGLPSPVRPDRDRAIKWFFENVPGLDFDDAMQMSGDERFYRLHDALHDDAYRNTSPATLCRKFGISWIDLLDLWRHYNIDLAFLRMATELPQIAEDVAQDALSREESCPECDGIGTLTDGNGQKTCPVCEGAGTVRVPGDVDARRQLFEIAGLTGRKIPIVAEPNPQ